MARYTAWAAFVGAVVLVVGCGPEKELPTVGPSGEGAGAQRPVAPAKSDPEAQAVIDRAVKALTGGKPELLAKGKFCRCVMKGQMFSIEQANQANDTTRTIVTAWPDRFFSSNEQFPLGNRALLEVWLRRPDLVITNNGTPVPLSNIDSFERFFAADVVGQSWMLLLLPATDPKAVAFDLEQITAGKRELSRLKLALGEFPFYQLTFDAKTDLLLRAEYTNSRDNVLQPTTMIFSEHKIVDGLMLPHQIECRHNGSVVEKWTVEKWEFPATIGDQEFSPSKKK
ncbi:unnamed protein product [Gemmata massiliana]|uniref:Uncharacterized protein n=1 Tax=Gemmata massiliana TaxID=1210884 RepID=A0A6P2CXU8_9BACT|nr:hypothetical protein [Gemmata massiliana]VTR93723.1 unnamed protein product [Gemmata massiliana]